MFGALVQTPDEAGEVHDLRGFIAAAQRDGVMTAVASDLLSLTVLTPPGEMGADVVFGNSQRFGVPMGYGGPHAAFFATLEKNVRQAPGRIIGAFGGRAGRYTAYRMALQTREQHIRREKATSNICTAEALLANIAGLYAVYHGPKGADRDCAARACVREAAGTGTRQGRRGAVERGFLRHSAAGSTGWRCRTVQEGGRREHGINLRYRADGAINVALNETTGAEEVEVIVKVFGGEAMDRSTDGLTLDYPRAFARTSAFLTHPVFNTYHSETQMMRYIRSLEQKDIGLETSMIPLGSCTMKLNAASEVLPVTWPEFSKLHPFAPGGNRLRVIGKYLVNSSTPSVRLPASRPCLCNRTRARRGSSRD